MVVVEDLEYRLERRTEHADLRLGVDEVPALHLLDQEFNECWLVESLCSAIDDLRFEMLSGLQGIQLPESRLFRELLDRVQDLLEISSRKDVTQVLFVVLFGCSGSCEAELLQLRLGIVELGLAPLQACLFLFCLLLLPGLGSELVLLLHDAHRPDRFLLCRRLASFLPDDLDLLLLDLLSHALISLQYVTDRLCPPLVSLSTHDPSGNWHARCPGAFVQDSNAGNQVRIRHSRHAVLTL